MSFFRGGQQQLTTATSYPLEQLTNPKPNGQYPLAKSEYESYSKSRPSSLKHILALVERGHSCHARHKLSADNP